MPTDRQRGNVTSRWGLAILTCVALAAVAAPLVGASGPYDQNLAARLLPLFSCGTGSPWHLAGTDHLGRDVLVRLLYGARLSLVVGAAAVTLGMAIGVAAGVIAGYGAGALDRVIMRCAAAQLAVPYVMLAMAVAAIEGPSVPKLVLVLGVTGWVPYARVVRAAVRVEAASGYVAAAQLLGASHARIVVRHVLPNASHVVVATAGAHFALVVLTESSLSFVGLGAPPTWPSWGAMLADGRDYVSSAPRLTVLPAMLLCITALGATLISDGWPARPQPGDWP